MTEFDARAQAVSESRFFAHLAVFAAATITLLAVYLAVDPGPSWAGWLALAWAVGLLGHAGSVFGLQRRDEWVRRRTASLKGGVSEADVHQVLDDALGALPSPAGTAQTLRQLQRRVSELEAADRARRPSAPGATSARQVWIKDPFADAREPIDTPALDAPGRS